MDLKEECDEDAHLCVVYPPKSGPCFKDLAAPLYYCSPGERCSVIGLNSYVLGDETIDPICEGNLPDVFVRLSGPGKEVS